MAIAGSSKLVVSREPQPPLILLPTLDTPSRKQVVVGRQADESALVEEFKGIPYASIPGRWQHSHLSTSLPADVFEATRTGPRCPQPDEPNNSNYFQSYLEFPTDQVESEFGCLNLAITRPSPQALLRIGLDYTTCKLPVLLWIHGGAYAFGSSADPMWNPVQLVKRSIELKDPLIVVGINYRLNVFGFFASSEIISHQPSSSSENATKGGNFGIRDQKLAMIWVSHNISSFGGNPQTVTIAGQSAGASSVHVHSLDSSLHGGQPLFRNTIIQSGAAGILGPIDLQEADELFESLCEHLKIHKDNEHDRVEALKNLGARDLLRAGQALDWGVFPLIFDQEIFVGSLPDFKVQINTQEEPVPAATIVGNEIPALKVLVGDVEYEAGIFDHMMAKIQDFDEIKSGFEKHISTELTSEILAIYGLEASIPRETLISRLSIWMGDALFHYPVHRVREGRTLLSTAGSDTNSSFSLAVARGTRKPADIQTYKFRTGNPFPGPNQGVAHHCVELIYLFNAFHVHLEQTDQLEKEEEERHSTADDTPAVVQDPSQILTPATTPTESSKMANGLISNPLIKLSNGAKMKQTNLTLSRQLSERWIRFITSDEPPAIVDDGPSEISIYEPDRSKRTENLFHGGMWVEQQRRFNMLRKCGGRGGQAIRAVVREISKQPMV